MDQIIEIMNEEYRKELKKITEKKKKLSETEHKIRNKSKISASDYERFKNYVEFLEQDIKLCKAYADGIFTSREKVINHVYGKEENFDDNNG